MSETKFTPGDKVQKPKGYKFDGIIRSQFLNGAGEIRYVAEMEGNGMLHIFSESQLDFRDYEVSSPLIAAAPAMYAAMQKLVTKTLNEYGEHFLEVSAHNENGDEYLAYPKLPEFVKEFQSILAAARGETKQSQP